MAPPLTGRRLIRYISRKAGGASRVDRAIAGDVIDLATPNADIVQFSVTQVAQPGPQLLPFAPFPEYSPAPVEYTEDREFNPLNSHQ